MKNGVRWLALMMLALVGICAMQAQPRGMKMTVSGVVLDSKTAEPLMAAAVKATSSDGGEGSFGITDESGKFSFEVARPGKYTLEFTYVGYKTFAKEYNFWPGRTNNVGKVKLEEDATMLKEAEVIGKSLRVKQTADTTVFNADGYKVMQGASAEELVAKMPGIKVTDSGVEAQGETVEKVLVDGKSFFENDPRLALKTLPAEVVQSVAVFDKKSDQSEFTGFDDGNTVKAMDVRTRNYRRNGLFGKVTAQYGTDNFYNFNFNLNQFSGNRRLTLMGLANNVNQQNFSFDDLMSSGGMGRVRMGNQSGVATTQALGLNFNDSYLDEKLEVQGSYFFNHSNTHLEDSVFQEYINIDRHTRQYDNNDTHNLSHRADMRINYRPDDANEIIFRPSFNLQKNGSDGKSENNTFYEGNLQNRSEVTSVSDGDAFNVGGNLVWRHKLAKEGRTFSIMASGNVSGSESDSQSDKRLNSLRTDQLTNAESNGYNLNANAMWTEPVGDNQQLSLTYEYGQQHSENDKTTSYAVYNDRIFEQDSIDTNLSNRFRSDYRTQNARVGYRFNTSTLNMMAEVGLQRADMKGEQLYTYYQGVDNLSYSIAPKVFYNVLPMLMLEWNGTSGSSLHLFYRSNANAPSVYNLQQSINNSNPLSLSTGNPQLDQTFSHNLHGRFIYSNTEKATNLMVFFGAGLTGRFIGNENTIVNATTTVDQLPIDFYRNGNGRFDGIELVQGAQITRPVNLDGQYNLNGGLSYGMPVDFLMSNLNLFLDGNYSVMPGLQNYISRQNNQLQLTRYDSKTATRSLAPGLSLTSNISQNLDFSVQYNLEFMDVKNSFNTKNNYNYLTHRATCKFSWVIWKGITMEHQLNWTYYTGSAMAGNDQNIWLWNASLGKKFWNNKLEAKLSGYDILAQNNAYSRSVNNAFISTSYTNVMPRYFMFTLVYNLQSFKGASEAPERRMPMMMR